MVWLYERLGRSTRHLLDLAVRLKERGCHPAWLTEAIDTSMAGGRLRSQQPPNGKGKLGARDQGKPTAP